MELRETKKLELHLDTTLLEYRENLSAVLRDDIQQSLVALRLDTEWLNRISVSDEQAIPQEHFESMLNTIDEVMQRINQVIDKLFPERKWHYCDINEAIESQINQFKPIFRNCEFKVISEVKPCYLSQEQNSLVLYVLYRVLSFITDIVAEHVFIVLRNKSANDLNITFKFTGKNFNLLYKKNRSSFTELKKFAQLIKCELNILHDKNNFGYFSLNIPNAIEKLST